MNRTADKQSDQWHRAKCISKKVTSSQGKVSVWVPFLVIRFCYASLKGKANDVTFPFPHLTLIGFPLPTLRQFDASAEDGGHSPAEALAHDAVDEGIDAAAQVVAATRGHVEPVVHLGSRVRPAVSQGQRGEGDALGVVGKPANEEENDHDH